MCTCIDFTRHRIGQIKVNLRSQASLGRIIKQGLVHNIVVYCDGSDSLRVTIVECADDTKVLTLKRQTTALIANEVELARVGLRHRFCFNFCIS